jgi:DinB superfamily
MQFDVLYQELARGAVMIQALVAGVTPEEARARPAPEAWSVLEVVCHLCDEEREDFRQHLDHILHRPDQTWPPINPYGTPGSPGGWVTARRYNERDLAQSLDEFLAERKHSLAWLKELSSPDWDRAATASFGPLAEQISIKAGDMLASWVAHDNLHMRQLVELRRARLLRLAEPYDVQYAGGW